jgi:DNA-binding transcriptional LysR family regulator
MTEKDWVLFKTIADEKNITKAAEKLYISQPAITYRLKMMEKEIGAKLLIRTSHGVLLTPEGECFLDYSRDMTLALEKTKEKIQSMTNKVQGTLRLGVSSVFAHYELPTILKEFLTLYPKVELSLKTGLSHRINRLLQRDEISIALLRGDYHWNEYKILIKEEPLCIASTEPINLERLPEKLRITYNTDTPLQSLVDDWCHQFLSSSFASSIEVDSMDTCRQLVIQGIGWAILPQIGLHSMENLHVYPLKWKDDTLFTRRTWLHSRNGAQDLILLNTFTKFMENYYLK